MNDINVKKKMNTFKSTGKQSVAVLIALWIERALQPIPMRVLPRDVVFRKHY